MIPAVRTLTLAVAAAAEIVSLDGCACTPAMPSGKVVAPANGTVLSDYLISSGSRPVRGLPLVTTLRSPTS